MQWLEVWIQFSHSLQLSRECYFSTSTDETHQNSQNSTNSVRAGHCLMVLLWRLWYHTTQGGYSISFAACQCWCSDTGGWDSHFRRAMIWRVCNLFHLSSRWWQSWTSLPFRAVRQQRLVHGSIWVLDTLWGGVVCISNRWQGTEFNLWSEYHSHSSPTMPGKSLCAKITHSSRLFPH